MKGNTMTAVVAVKTRVIFTRKEVQKKTDSGIILSNPNQEQNPLGYVHSIGDKVDIEALAVGDAISVNWQSVGMLEHNSTKYYIVDQNNINAIIK
jgi:co-chaperonin GroES (HSP10)